MSPQATVIVPLGVLAAVPVLAWIGLSTFDSKADVRMTHASFDPTRELYREFNGHFAPEFQSATGKQISIRMSHGGSGSQARAVQEGLSAQVLSLAVWPDMDVLARKGFIAKDWETRLPHRSSPAFSTIVIVTRKPTPLTIRDWPDLLDERVEIVTANPKTGGGARVTFLAAWCAARKRGLTEAEADEFMGNLYRRVKIMDASARAATVSFSRRGIGNVHLGWENETLIEKREMGDAIEVVYPESGSLRADLPVTWVDANLDETTRPIAEQYVRELFEPAAQKLFAEQGFRPIDGAGDFPTMPLIDLEEFLPGGWAEAQKRFFDTGGLFDRIMASR